ncbi:MAG: hypothetical protein WC959_03140 [Kiritimatiellales bacterium]
MITLKLVAMLIIFSTWSAYGGAVIQFGGNKNDILNEKYKSQVDADEIVAWFGGSSAGTSARQTGSLKDAGAGALLTSVKNGLSLTSIAVLSTDPARIKTVTYGRALGVNSAGSTGAAAMFNTEDATEWIISFNKDITLQKILFTGFNYPQDIAEISVENGSIFTVTGNKTPLAAWTGTQTDRVYTLTTPVTVSAGTKIKIKSLGKNDWGLGGIIVETL